MPEGDAGTGLSPIRYHQLTKHTPTSVRTSTFRVDWTDQPQPFKDYPDLEPVRLPARAADTGFPAAAAVAGSLGVPRMLDAPEVSRLLTLAAGVRRVRGQPGNRPAYLRTYASAGALYPLEVYLASAGIPGVPAGLYHYSPLDDGLRLLRDQDPRPYLIRACGGRPSLKDAPVCVILTGVPLRTTWKYRARGYRHLFWDGGMILANLLALCASGGHVAEVVMGFDDEELNRLLGVDGTNEMAICTVPIGYRGGFPMDVRPAQTARLPAEPVQHRVAKLSRWEREYQEILEAHRQTSLATPMEAQLWQEPPAPAGLGPQPPLRPDAGIEQVIWRRGSKRSFERRPIMVEHLTGVLSHATHHLACDWGGSLTQIGLIANQVDGLPSGSYAFVDGLDLMQEGDLREKAQFLCLDQPLGGDASATLFLLTDLEDAALTLGKRSYRAAQLEAGIVAGRIYLCCYACGLRATGLTFYDDEVRAFFQTEAEPMMVVAVGH